MGMLIINILIINFPMNIIWGKTLLNYIYIQLKALQKLYVYLVEHVNVMPRTW